MVNDTANFIAGFGIIPNDWSCKTANEICTKISKGTTPPKSEISNDGKIPFLRVNNLTFHGHLALDSDFIFVSKESHENFLSRSMAFPNDILMNIVGPPLGKTALLDDSYPEYNMNQAIVFYRLQKNLVDSKYFLEFLNSFKAQQWLQSRSKKTSGQQNLTIEICKELPIILPSLLEQKKIAQILSTWDQVISATEKLLKNSQQQKKALMQQLLTGKKRLLDENGERFSGDWNTATLGEIGEIKSAGVDKKIVDGEIPIRLLNFTDVFKRNFIYSDELNHWVTAPISKVESCDVRKGDVFFTPSSETRDETGIPAVAAEDIPNCCYSYHIVRFRISEQWDLNFKAYAFTASNFRKQIDRLADGSGQRYVVSQDNFRSIIVHYPNFEEQVAIGKVLKSAEDEIHFLQRELDCLKQEKKALMQQLLTGKRRVKV
ncbi:hypothetical protein Asch01_01677 [Acinetobacter schindleri]|uniref:restriction endonuclease subunit S n=1 Tax=Acinetobacter schindleri TaxID=108981 RepID=UPI0030A55FEF